jgi:hypothetical protein
MRGTDPWPDVPVATRRTRAGTFRCPDVHRHHLAVFDGRVPSLGQRILGVDLVVVLLHHEIDADSGGVRFLAGLGQEDHIAIERHVIALQQQHHHQVR